MKLDYNVQLETWVVLEDYIYKDIVVPRGFQTDLASIPKILWNIIAPFELSTDAPVVHDFLYHNGGLGKYTRKQADQIFLELMAKEGVTWWKRHVAYRAVRLFAWGSWKDVR